MMIEANTLEKRYRDGIEEGRVEGIGIGRVEGEKIGEEKGKIEIARKMLEDNMPIDIIVKYSGLTKDEIGYCVRKGSNVT